jgi:hypothetical protein
MCKKLKPGQLCTVDEEVYRCSKQVTSPCLECYYHYRKNWHKPPCEKWALRRGIPTCRRLFGGGMREKASFPILVSTCKK